MIVYLLHNRVTDKGYVGKTKRTLEQRWKEHVRNAVKGRAEMPLYAAIRKHRSDAFNNQVLQECMDEESLDAAEKQWIAELRTFGRGYNATEGGDGVKGLRHTEATKKRMSEKRLGKKLGPMSGETKAKIAEARVGKGFGTRLQSRGWHHSLDSRIRISRAAQRAKAAIAVQQLDTEGTVIATYKSMSAASQAVGGNGRGIRACCDGRQKTYLGYGWKFDKE